MSTNDVSRLELVRDAKTLEYLTIGWNSLEALIAIFSGLLAGSIALVGFGFDSIIEVSSGIALLYRLSMDADERRRERLELRTLKMVGTTFLALAAYIVFSSGKDLLNRTKPGTSIVGIVLALSSLVVMPILARAKRRIAARIISAALHADSRQTDICAYLSAILLSGLVLNAIFGWWWADPVAALLMVPIIVIEGVEALRGKTCCDDPCQK